ncbi:hypothetical protein [Methylococcus geothermalis]|uniref:CHAT domain-containing protein n=1 Tax=Methylococcus geothermalis TaxID=2681310 RepID=A0A858QAW4_9GAMM|nr:hypothetical protein [Methylococcus geothermalis]QJD30963.1 hypothetical protein GNH96_14050 [Methylococcus geothermalis]
MDANRFNQILVVDSIPAGELNTAKRLIDDISTYAAAYSPSPAVKYVRVETGDELIEQIHSCRKAVLDQGIVPMLHIECHGDEDGFQFADGSLADWEELKLPITELNAATHLNLMIAVAACTGGALAKVLRMSDRAPFWGLIGPTKTVTAAALEKAYRALYLTLLSTKSPAEAVKAMDAATEPGLFLRTTAQGLFEKGWAGYRKDYCTPEALDIRAKRMQARFMELSDTMPPSLEELRTRLIKHEPKAFERYRANFFMYDLFPEHRSRFPIQYVP